MPKKGIPMEQILWTTEKRKIIDLIPAKYNPRKSDDKEYRQLEKSLKHKFIGGGKFKTSVWEINKPHKSDLHPTMKPIELIENALLNSSERGDLCLDLFLGSGSTLIACEKTSRICYGMEIDPIYCQVIIDRWEKFSGKKAEKINVGSN
jgi:DNA modification methylase